MSRPPDVPQLVVEVAFASDPLASSYTKGVMSDVANSTFTTPSTSAKVLGDIEIVARVAFTDWTPAVESVVICRWFPGASNAGWLLSVTATGQLKLYTSADGTTELSQASSAGTWVNGAAYWIKATLDVDNGAGGRVYSFYQAPDSEVEPASWTTISTHTVAGTTTLFDVTQTLEVGSLLNAFNRLTGDVYRVFVRNGINGTVVADFNPADAGSASATTWGASAIAGQTWTRGAGASLSISPSWTDVSAYVRSVNGVEVRRGKQSEVETTASSSLSLTLDNRDRRFDPTYASSPYAGNLKPRKAIRVRALWNNTYYPVFQGFIDGWPQDYFFRRDASCSITAYDALAVAAQVEIQSFAYDYLRTTVGDLIWYLYNIDQNRWFDLQGTTPGVLAQGTMTVDRIGDADGDGVAFDGNTIINFDYTTIVNGSFSYSFWLSTTSKGVGTDPFQWCKLIDSGRNVIGIDNLGRLSWYSTGSEIRSIQSVATGAAVFCTIVQDGVTPYVYVNGSDVSDPATRSTSARPGPNVATIGGPAEGFNGSAVVGVMQSVAGVGKALSAAQVQTLYGYARRDLIESTSMRMGRLLDFMGWPAGLRDLTTHAQVDVREVPADRQLLLAMMQTVADSEYGRLFVTKDGKVALQDRFWHITSTRGSTTQATFADDGSDLFYAGTGFDYSDREVANRVTVVGSFGRSATQEDTASKDDYGLQTFSLSTILAMQAEVNSAADGILSRRKDPILRADAITVKPARQTSSWPTVLGLELGDRIVVEITPMGVSPQIQRTLLVERLDWSISIDRWELAITGSPVPAESYWLLDTSELDTETVLGW